MNISELIQKYENHLDVIRSSFMDHVTHNTWDMAETRVAQGILITEFLKDLNALQKDEAQNRGPG